MYYFVTKLWESNLRLCCVATRNILHDISARFPRYTTDRKVKLTYTYYYYYYI